MLVLLLHLLLLQVSNPIWYPRSWWNNLFKKITTLVLEVLDRLNYWIIAFGSLTVNYVLNSTCLLQKVASMLALSGFGTRSQQAPDQSRQFRTRYSFMGRRVLETVMKLPLQTEIFLLSISPTRQRGKSVRTGKLEIVGICYTTMGLCELSLSLKPIIISILIVFPTPIEISTSQSNTCAMEWINLIQEAPTVT